MTRRIDFAPIDAPANPQAQAARAAMREYAAMMRGETVSPEPEQAPAPDALIEAVFAHWPDMRPYQHTARLEQVYDAQRGEWRMAVTVTIFETDSNI